MEEKISVIVPVYKVEKYIFFSVEGLHFIAIYRKGKDMNKFQFVKLIKAMKGFLS